MISLSLLSSSSLRKSLVFCASSFLCVSVSLWCATRSEATVSSCGMSAVRSISEVLLALAHGLIVVQLYFSKLQWPFGTCCPPRSLLVRLVASAPPLAPHALPRPDRPPWLLLVVGAGMQEHVICFVFCQSALACMCTLTPCVVSKGRPVELRDARGRLGISLGALGSLCLALGTTSHPRQEHGSHCVPVASMARVMLPNNGRSSSHSPRHRPPAAAGRALCAPQARLGPAAVR